LKLRFKRYVQPFKGIVRTGKKSSQIVGSELPPDMWQLNLIKVYCTVYERDDELRRFNTVMVFLVLNWKWVVERRIKEERRVVF